MPSIEDLDLSNLPPTPTPNYIDPVRRAWMPAFAVSWQVLATVMLAGRLYLRARRQAGSFGLDDLFIFFAWLFSVGLTAAVYVTCEHHGLDRHVWDVEPWMFAPGAMFFWLSQVLFTVSSICTKLSVLLFYRRMMMDTLDRRWIYALWVALGFTISYGIAILIGHFFICQPLEALWNIMTPGFDKSFTCIDSAAFTLASGVLGTVSDGYAVALPCLMLRNYDLDASRRQRVALNVVFGLGLLVSGCGVARTYWLWKTNHTLGPTWNNFELLAWTIAECQLGVICACAPAWRVFFRRYLRDNLRRRFGSALGSYSQDQSKEVAMVTTATTEHDTRSYVDLEDLAVDAAGRIVPAHTLRGPTAARRGNDQRSGSKGGSCTTTTTDDTRSSIGVQNLETDAADGVHPAYTTNEENGEWKGNGHAANGSDEKCPTPTISNTEQFEAYAIARLSLLSKHKYPTLVQVPAPKTDEATGSRQKCKDKYAV